MLPEWGHFALILALAVSLLQSSTPWWPVSWAARWIWVRGAATLHWLLVCVAFVVLGLAFYNNDLSVAYVAANSHHLLPAVYRLTAIWGGHEGSFLLWVFWLATWSGALVFVHRPLPTEMASRMLAVMGMLSGGLLLFVLATSNPFARYLPWVPRQGQDLNPLLQDPGLVIHPPILYAGYVGFALAFAWAIAALWQRRLEPAWAAWLRPWVLCAWAALTYGIVLGSWWAYRELGWGGWWFWDPVENASLMPWVAGTALVHALRSTSQMNHFRLWTLCMCLVAFSLSLLGTFLVRSGVLVSVHAFATDPARGVVMLLNLGVVIGVAWVFFMARSSALRQHQTVVHGSRSYFLWLNHLFLMVILVTVLVGTLYPIFYQAMGWGRLSVGAPYFNALMVWLAAPLFICMGMGPTAPWRASIVWSRWLGVACVVCLLIFSLLWWGTWSWVTCLGLAMALWLAVGLWRSWWCGWRWPMWRVPTWPRVSMTLAHLGVLVFLLGVTLTSALSVHQDVVLGVGDEATLGGYRFVWQSMHAVHGSNYEAVEAAVKAYDPHGRLIRTLRPQQRIYTTRQTDLAKTAIDAGVFRDLYVALGQSAVDEHGDVIPHTWSFRLYVKPFVRWIWAGGWLMALGGLSAALHGWRCRFSRRAHDASPA